MDKEVTLKVNREKNKSPKEGTSTFLKYVIYSFIIPFSYVGWFSQTFIIPYFFGARHISVLDSAPPLFSWEALHQWPVFSWFLFFLFTVKPLNQLKFMMGLAISSAFLSTADRCNLQFIAQRSWCPFSVFISHSNFFLRELSVRALVHSSNEYLWLKVTKSRAGLYWPLTVCLHHAMALHTHLSFEPDHSPRYRWEYWPTSWWGHKFPKPQS